MTTERAGSSSSRADQIRQKRQQASQERISQARQQATHSYSQPVATTVRRASPYSIPVTHSTRVAPQRKVRYTQSTNGVEVRMPALPSIQFNWQTASAFLAVVFLLLVILLSSLDTFNVNEVEVQGMQRVSSDDIHVVIASNSHSIFTLDKQKVIKALTLAFPEMKDIHLNVVFPDKVVVSATERQPIMAWNSGDTTEWIDAEGVIMPVRGDAGTLLTISSSVTPPLVKSSETSNSETTDDPTESITVEETIHIMDVQTLQAAINLAAQLPQGASLVYDPVSGMGWKDTQGWEVFFGNDLSNIQLKQAEYLAIVDRLTALGISPSLISVEFVDAPYYRTE